MSLLLLVLAVTACRHAPPVVQPSAFTATVSASAVPSGLRYFGYFGSNYISPGAEEAADHTNIVMIDASRAWQEEAILAASRGQSTVLNVLLILFDSATMTLRPDYAARWRTFAATVPQYLPYIAAFYHMDEPGTNAASHPFPGCLYPWQAGAAPCWTVRLATMRHDVEAVNAIIKASFPDVPIMAAFGSHELFGDDFAGWTSLPAGYDWVGFDCYGDFLHCARYGHSVPATLARLRSLLTPGQRIVWFPDGSRFDALAYGTQVNGSPDDLLDRVVQYYLLALATPETVAIFPYLWSGYDDLTFGRTDGVRELPGVRALYTRIGQTIIRGQLTGENWGAFGFGLASDIPFIARTTKYGQPGPVMYRPAEGAWYVSLPDEQGSGFHSFEFDNYTRIQFGLPGDVPFTTRLAPWCTAWECPVIFRPSEGSWYIGTRGFIPTCDQAIVRIQFGASGDIPKIVYWDGAPHLAVYRPSTRQTIASTTNGNYRPQDTRVW